MEDRPAKGWSSIHTRAEITSRYKIHDLIGSGAYTDVYRATRLADGVTVARKEVRDYRSAFREIEAVRMLRGAADAVEMHEYLWREDEDAVLVLEYPRSDLGRQGFSWIMEISRTMISHRMQIPLLVSPQSTMLRILLRLTAQNRLLMGVANPEAPQVMPTLKTIGREEYYRELEKFKSKCLVDDVTAETTINDGNTSCMATCIASDLSDNPSQGSYAYEAEDAGEENMQGALASCVGTRWFKAPELLYGSIDYGLNVDLWALGCIFAELLTLEPLFPGASDIDQLGRIFNVLGNLTEEVWPGCAKLPDFWTITFAEVESPTGIVSCLPNRSHDEVALVQGLVCYDPAARASASELLQHKYFREEPLPVPVSDLQVPLAKSGQDEDSSDDWNMYNDMGPDSDFDDREGYNYKFRVLCTVSLIVAMHSCSKHVLFVIEVENVIFKDSGACSFVVVIQDTREILPYQAELCVELTNASHKGTQEDLSYHT